MKQEVVFLTIVLGKIEVNVSVRESERKRERERERESIICQHNGQGIMIVPNGTNKLKFQRKGSGKKRFIFSELFFPGCDVAVKKTLAQLF